MLSTNYDKACKFLTATIWFGICKNKIYGAAAHDLKDADDF